MIIKLLEQLFSISQIGELVKILDKQVIEKYNTISWSEMRGLRNKIVHDYDGIQFRVIWEVIKEDLPQLIENIMEILTEYP